MSFCSSIKTVLGVAVFIVSLSTTSGYSRSELGEVKEQLEILTNEVSRLADANSPSTDDAAHPQDPVTLLSVERVRGVSGTNVFTLNFTKNVPEVYYVLSVYGSRVASGNEVGQEVIGTDGVTSYTMICSDRCSSAGRFDLSISDMNQSSVVRLQIDNSDYDPKTQAQLKIPNLVIKHEGDLVYEPHKDVSVKVSVPYSSGRHQRFSNVRAHFRVIDEDGWRFGDRSVDDWIEKETRKYLKAAETTFTINTSKHHLSGFLVLSVSFDDSEAPLVRKYEVEKLVGLRPSSQRGPFPDDFLTFPGFGNGHGDLTTHTDCFVGQNCTLICSAIGGFMTDLQVIKLTTDGDWEPYTDVTELVLGYYRKVEWTVQPDGSSENMKFQCLAKTAVSNISRQFNVTVLSDDFYIDQSRTSWEVVANETNPEITSVTLNCTIVGWPLVEGYFVMGLVHEDEYQMYTYFSYAVADRIALSRDETLITATVSFDPEENPAENVLEIYCRAQSGSRYEGYEMFDHENSSLS